QREVENHLRDALHYDRARVQTGKISRFGLLELSRQRLRPSLGETNHMPCPRCHGTGHIRGIESTALHILRITQEEAMKENSAIIQVQLPVEAATFLLNEKRAEIHKIEQRMDVQVVLIPNIHMETPNYNILRIRHDDVTEETTRASYAMVELPSEIDEAGSAGQEPKAARLEAAVKGITPASPAPTSVEKPEKPSASPSLVTRIKGWFSKITETKQEEAAEPAGREANRNNQRRNNRNNRGRGGRGERPEQKESRGNERGNRAQEPRQPQAAQQRPERAEQRPEKVEREKQPQVVQPVQAAAGAEATGEQRGGRRGRGRRDRGPRADNAPRHDAAATQEEGKPRSQARAEQVEKINQPAVAPAVEAVESAPASVVEKIEPVAVIEAKVETAQPKAARTSAAKTAAATAPAKEASTASQAETDTQPVAGVAEKAEKKPRAPRRRKPAEAAAKPVDLAASGLQLVETKAETVKAVTPPVTEEITAKPRKQAAWQQKSAEKPKDEPLVMVETQK
ncbi:MAG TPA: ribonuclease E/G, partial [Methylophilaceae bacterium]|nr:ribonuclease E/G [Methylophilaceae bacterium]